MAFDPSILLCPFQKRWLAEPAALALGEKSRRIGWTWCQAFKAVLDRVAGRGNYYHPSADMTAAVEFIDYCKDWAEVVNAVAEVVSVGEEREMVDGEEITTQVMKFRGGTKIVAGSSNPKFFRSKGGAVGLDEFAFHRDGRELYKAAHATALFWGDGSNGGLRIWSTHNGPTTYFNQLCRSAERGELEAALHKVTIEDAVEDGIVERIRMRQGRLDYVPAVDLGARKAWIQKLRATCPDQDTWNEEYLCIPSSDGSSLLSYGLIQGCETPNLNRWTFGEDGFRDADGKPVRPGGPIYAGYDVGRSKDRSVLWVVEQIGDVFYTRIVDVLANTNFTVQEDRLNLLMRGCPVRRLCIDQGLIGLMLAERLATRWGYRAEGIQFNVSSMAAMAMPLLRLFEDKRIRIPAEPDIREDLHKVQKIVNGTNVRFVAPRDGDGHADRFWALALACHAADSATEPLPPSQARKPAGW